MSIKWIILDAWGVIYYPTNLIEEILIPFLRNKKINLKKEKVYKIYFEASIGKIKSKDIWKKLGLIHQFPEIETEYINSQKSILDSGFKETVNELKPDHQIGMISNDVKEWAFSLLDKFKINHFFNLIYISGEKKIRKPNTTIFQHFINELEVNPAECIFIDDRLINLKAAAKVGLKTLRFIRKNGKIPFCSEFEVSSFKEIKNVLFNFLS